MALELVKAEPLEEISGIAPELYCTMQLPDIVARLNMTTLTL